MRENVLYNVLLEIYSTITLLGYFHSNNRRTQWKSCTMSQWCYMAHWRTSVQPWNCCIGHHGKLYGLFLCIQLCTSGCLHHLSVVFDSFCNELVTWLSRCHPALALWQLGEAPADICDQKLRNKQVLKMDGWMVLSFGVLYCMDLLLCRVPDIVNCWVLCALRAPVRDTQLASG